MPKDTIGPATPADKFRVEIGWSEQRKVQLSVVTVTGASILVVEPGDDNLEFLGAIMIDAVDTSHDRPDRAQWVAGNVLNRVTEFTGLTYSPDREECNRIIRSIRKARTSVFGSDE